LNSQKYYWNEIFKARGNKTPKYDLWLDKYDNMLIKSIDVPIIDLGCGFGNNTLYLKERGYEVIACDFSEEALKVLSNLFNNLNVKCFDMQDGLPFENSTARVIISDLSLHYFSWKDTQKILKEISRVLMKDGILLCRFNSINDRNYGAGQGIEIEENFYDIDGNLKRFFSEEQLRELFKDWDIQYIEESEMNRYNNIKIAWEIAIKKI